MCGFEAFINGKHIIGEVKEKEQAHKEYREAISQGHGAYLMDEETPVCAYLSFVLHDHLSSFSLALRASALEANLPPLEK